METMMMKEIGDLSRSSSSSTASRDVDFACAWSNWEPVADWAPFSAPVADDFDDLVDSMICPDVALDDPAALSSMSNTSADTPIDEEVNTYATAGDGDDKDLRLVHLLVAAAEALDGPHRYPELARVILVRLKELVERAGVDSGGGTSIERLAAHFADALQGLLDGGVAGRSSVRDVRLHHNKADVLTAFQLLQDMSPYIKFGHFTANQAILEACLDDRRVHVVDFDIDEGVQWASLMQALVSRPGGRPPPPHLRITAVSRGGGSRAMQETGRRLAAFAASLGQPFSFSHCRLDADERFRPASVKVVKGETVVMNCMLHPTMAATRRGRAASVASFLSGAAELGAKVVTMVEEEDDDEREDLAAEEERGFAARFMAELRRYSTVWDSLEAGFPMQGRARGMVERVILGPGIAGAVNRAYREGKEEGEKEGNWGEWVTAMGFMRVGISCFNHCQAKLLLGLFNDGYKVEEDGINKLVLGWKTSRLLSASVWKPPPPPHLLLPSSPPILVGTTSSSGFTTSFEDSDFIFD
ncbi:hypothetical protein Cni_G02118 [Canna indica]|uniref:Nodulation signaling pathway 2-like protein n=1 Tax=Canna indica TaxID=4628 RepID=A0AAQ3JPG9_9LILI|nr:hypothetical protein Cni_G02118 [Canna indica]